MQKYFEDEEIIGMNKDSYNTIVQLWKNRVHDNFDFEYHKLCRESFTEELKGTKILEVGCGLGIDSINFYLMGYDIIATDIADVFINNLKNCNLIKTLIMDMSKPTLSEYFNGIYSFASFLHVPHKYSKRTLKGFFKLLYNDGILFLHHAESRSDRNQYIVENIFGQNKNLYCYTHSKEEIRILLQESGFRKVEFLDIKSSKTFPADPGDKYKLNIYDLIAFK
jgi:cyclopropane fatty-acyl-phospholipid synthase-like methyltransferase